MADNFVESTTAGWGSRLIESIKGVGIGLLLVGISVVALFWNEGRAVHREQALEEGATSVVSVSPEFVDSKNEAKLIHVAGEAKTAKGLADNQFDIKAPTALRLFRKVEMYQWEQDEKTETKKNFGGSEERITTYSYEKVWSDQVIDSSKFKKAGHVNPDKMRFDSATQNASDVQLGKFKVNDLILEQLAPNKSIAPAVEAEKSGNSSNKTYTVSNSMLYFGKVDSPAIGDVRVGFTEFPAGPISIVARQIKDTFEEYKAKTGDVLLVQAGIASADAMFKQAEEENKTITWIIRGVGFLFIVIGFNLMLSPFVTLADVIPFIGSIIGAGTFLAALAFAIPVWLITVGVAWFVYRPILGIGLIAAAIVVPILFRMMFGSKPATA